jgi:iron transport multicopper oxidase
MITNSVLLLTLSLVHQACASLVQKTITVTNGPVSIDGFRREATLVDGKVPGTTISGNKGDRFEITVTNDLTSEKMYQVTSVHWHGIHMHHSSWADGSAMVSQCPLIPGHSFKYAWDTSERGSSQAGTFWYHSHFSTQYCDGLRGALIIRDESDRDIYDYDIDNDDTIINLSDWFHFYGKDFKPGPPVKPPFPDSSLINGKGRDPYNPISDLAIITVEPGKRYRMRVIQMACYTAFDYSIDGHTLTVIEADSILTEPYEVDSIYVFAGQRYSHILDTRDTRPDAYWIRAQPERLVYTYLIREESGANYTIPYWGNNTNVAVLRYTNSPNLFPTTPADVNVPISTQPLLESELRPLYAQQAPGAPAVGQADVNIELKSVFNEYHDGRFRINNATYDSPDIPILLQIMSGAGSAMNLLPRGSLIPLPRDKVIEVRIKGTERDSGGPHPFHLHGHDFYVIKPPRTEVTNFENPMRRDTISSGMEDEEAIIRFETNNPGPWFLHCHLDWHLDMGMAVIMVEDAPSVAKEKAPPEEWHEMCEQYDAFVAGGSTESIHMLGEDCSTEAAACQRPVIRIA